MMQQESQRHCGSRLRFSLRVAHLNPVRVYSTRNDARVLSYVPARQSHRRGQAPRQTRRRPQEGLLGYQKSRRENAPPASCASQL
jgi:hypothetical protein